MCASCPAMSHCIKLRPHLVKSDAVCITMLSLIQAGSLKDRSYHNKLMSTSTLTYVASLTSVLTLPYIIMTMGIYDRRWVASFSGRLQAVKRSGRRWSEDSESDLI
ncbi:hypothetical protein BDR03DRAFT_967215 [Suillus americanus]|nr:hypothetical protein BDR03DRAFT_967215 [Suillus americanus]